eukprot:6185891-Alexandrium_andersonii.AAC.1
MASQPATAASSTDLPDGQGHWSHTPLTPKAACVGSGGGEWEAQAAPSSTCLLYTSPSPRD